MNAGRDYARAKRQAQANADRSQSDRWLSLYGGTWWIDASPVEGAEKIASTPASRPAEAQEPRS